MILSRTFYLFFILNLEYVERDMEVRLGLSLVWVGAIAHCHIVCGNMDLGSSIQF